MVHERERDAAVRAVLAASRLCRRVRRALVAGSTHDKADRSPVTVADYGSQAVVSAILAEAAPDVPLVGEEDAAELRRDERAGIREKVVGAVREELPALDGEAVLAAIDRGTHPGGPAGRFWTLDPIDGTKGFLRMDQYAVALALVEDGEVVLGVLGCPNLPLDAAEPDGPRGCVFVAERGAGARTFPVDGGEERQLRVSEAAEPAAARFCESVEKAHTAQDHAARVAEILGIAEPPFRIDSQCKYAAVARGDAEIYLRLPTRKDYVERIWDHAAGWIVVTEAGGRVTDVRGRPLAFGHGRGLAANKGVVATNGRFHDRVVDAVREVLGL